VKILPQYIERIVVVPDLKVAGTLDRIVDPGGQAPLQIADVKTGKDLSYGWLEIAIQLALYAHAEAMWNDQTQTYEPVPALDLDHAMVMHLPVGKAQCDLYSVDIAAGWEAAQVCQAVRQWRSRRNLANPRRGDPNPSMRRAVKSLDLNTRIDNAATVDDLTDLWAEADAAGTWTTGHTARAAKKKKQLLAPAGA
jgi:hypothetical protein